jgi:hypothetical protein
MPRRILFAVRSPLGYRVVLSRDRWREIIRFKHPALAGKQELVRICLREPEVIRSSSKIPMCIFFTGAENELTYASW